MSSVLELEGFTRAALEDLGCLVERVGNGTLEAVLTPDVVGATHLPDVVRLAFGEREDGVRLQPGLPAMDGLLALCTQELAMCRTVLPLPDRAGRGKVESLLSERLSFPNSRPSWGAEAWPATVWLRCGFLASFRADERRELVEQVVYDLTRRCVVAAGPGGEGQTGGEATLDPALVEAALLAAAGEARTRLGRRIESWLKRCRDRENVDLARAEEYFKTLEAELQKRLRSARQRGTDVSGLESKLDVLKVEADRRRRDLADKHAVQSSLHLAVLELIEAPRGRITIEISNRYAAASVMVHYNPFSRMAEGVACHGCQQETVTLWLCINRHVMCSDCARPCTTCRRVSCRDCGSGVCPRCGKLWCSTCQRVKPGCSICGVAQCDNCAALGSCHAIKERRETVEEQPVPTLPAVYVQFNPDVREWGKHLPKEPMVRATTTDSTGALAILYTTAHHDEEITVGFRLNVLTGRMKDMKAGVMRQTERKILQRELLPSGTAWCDVRWPFPIAVADILSGFKAHQKDLDGFVKRYFPGRTGPWPRVFYPGRPHAVSTDIWTIADMTTWSVLRPEDLDATELAGALPVGSAKWRRILARYEAYEWSALSIERRLHALLLLWAHLTVRHPREAEVFGLLMEIRSMGMRSAAVQALVERDAARAVESDPMVAVCGRAGPTCALRLDPARRL